MDGAALVANWSLLGVLVAALGLSLTIARRTWLGQPFARWFLVIWMPMEIVELVNLYVRRPWAAELFFIVGPVAAVALIAGSRFRPDRRRPT